MLVSLEYDIIIKYRERLTRFGYEAVERSYGRKGARNRAQHAIEDMSHETDEEARREYEYEADEAEEDAEETQTSETSLPRKPAGHSPTAPPEASQTRLTHTELTSASPNKKNASSHSSANTYTSSASKTGKHAKKTKAPASPSVRRFSTRNAATDTHTQSAS